MQASAILLVVLAIRKQAFHVCHPEAALVAEESASMDNHPSRGTANMSGSKKHLDSILMVAVKNFRSRLLLVPGLRQVPFRSWPS